MEYKQISIFNLDFQASKEETIRKSIAYRYNS